MTPEQLAVAAHPPRFGVLGIALTQTTMRLTQRFRQQQLHGLAEQLLAGVAEQKLGLPVDHDDIAAAVD